MFYNHGDYETAISYYDKAIQINEGFKDAWYNKAAALKN
ncbi:tetratricopeptide repeat protein [Methanospirillum sp. J.3.6.1-F.2.7.3]|uniref:Tetratricopeptide repeat protein n=1 Tax=Methanospirillum purgamenti TaxID=2834276 RepID=A0A8E7EK29_9EURY|nr:tetratricopeptide repeat protein [Methanospirillum sp. J.3.6.1-F.2.7.3]